MSLPLLRRKTGFRQISCPRLDSGRRVFFRFPVCRKSPARFDLALAVEFYSFVADNYVRELKDQINSCSCLTLILGCIIYWRANEISRVVSRGDADADGIDWAHLKHISPIEWKYVVLYGQIPPRPPIAADSSSRLACRITRIWAVPFVRA